MKYRVIKPFIDRLTQEPYNSGYIYETADMERVKELSAGGYIATPKAVSESDTKTAEIKTEKSADKKQSDPTK